MTTPKSALPELSNNANQYLTANMSFAIIDQLMVPVVADKDLTAAPGSPVDGAMYIMASAWSGATLTAGSPATAAGRLIFWRASANAWTVITPGLGWRVSVADEVDGNGVAKLYICKTTGATSAWSLTEASPITTRGDVIVGGAGGANIRLGIGSAGQVLTSNGTDVLWGAGGGGGGSTSQKFSAYLATAASSTSAGWQKVPLDTVSFDTGSYWDATNKRFLPTVAGYYQVTVRVRRGSTGNLVAGIGRNGTQMIGLGPDGGTSYNATGGTAMVYLNGSTDYIEAFAYAVTVAAWTTGTFDTYMQVLGPL